MRNRQHICTWILLLCSLAATSQVQYLEYFNDTLGGSLDYIYDYVEVEDGILVSGRSDFDGLEHPVILKLDLAGDVQWSTLNSVVQGTTQCRGIYFDTYEDGWIYAIYYEGSAPNRFFWKVDPDSGIVAWTTPFYPTNFRGDVLSDYDSTTFLDVHHVTQQNVRLALIDKATGDSLSTYQLNLSGFSVKLTVDASKNLYTAQNATITKYNRKDLNQIIWQNSYLLGNYPINEVHRVYIDDIGGLYVFGRDGGSFGHGGGIVARVDPQTGALIWKAVLAGSSVSIADMVDRDGYIFATYRHTLVGSGSYNFRTGKVHKETGVVEWMSSAWITPVGSPASHSGNGEAGLSLDIDCSGDLLVTGYYGDANYGPEQWGLVKLDGSTGSVIYDNTITNDLAFYDNYSVGKASCIFGDYSTLLGHLEDTALQIPIPMFATIDSATGAVDILKRIDGSRTAYSETSAIKHYSDTTFVLKQVGNQVVVEHYLGDTLNWLSVVSGALNHQTGNISVTNTKVFVSHYMVPADGIGSPSYVYLSELSRISGALVTFDSIAIGSTKVKPIELLAEGTDAYLLYASNDSLYYSHWNGSALSTSAIVEYHAGHFSWEGNYHRTIIKSTVNLWYFGADAVIEINKQSGAVTPVLNYSLLNAYDLDVVADSIFVAGSNSTGNPTLLIFDQATTSIIWQYSYPEQGFIGGVQQSGAGFLAVAGDLDNDLFIGMLDLTASNEEWRYIEDPLSTTGGSFLDMDINLASGNIAAGGYRLNVDSATDAILRFVSLAGDTNFIWEGYDQFDDKSYTKTVAFGTDSVCWAGGSHSKTSYSKAGFMLLVKPAVPDTTLGVQSLGFSGGSFMIYPNPSAGAINIVGIEGFYSYQVYSAFGQSVLEGTTIGDNRSIEVAALSTGLYLIELRNGTTRISRQFVIQR